MNDYIELDGKKYATVGKAWQPQVDKPVTVTLLADGTRFVTYGTQALESYAGEIVARPVESREGWGASSDLETSLKAMRNLAFTDHLGAASQVAVAGYKRRSLTYHWDGAGNKFYYEVRLVIL